MFSLFHCVIWNGCSTCDRVAHSHLDKNIFISRDMSMSPVVLSVPIDPNNQIRCAIKTTTYPSPAFVCQHSFQSTSKPHSVLFSSLKRIKCLQSFNCSIALLVAIKSHHAVLSLSGGRYVTKCAVFIFIDSNSITRTKIETR